MDVFNGLEDVRQYFQGLPAATGTTASPSSYQQHQPTTNTNGNNNNNNNNNNTNSAGPEPQNHDRPAPNNISYWPPQHDIVVQATRPPTRENTPQRPSSHHSDSSASRPPSHHNIQQQQQQQQQEAAAKSRTNIQSGYGNYVNHDTSPATFQFSVPHSREAPSNAQSQSYQSHILPNPSYHQNTGQQQQHSMQQQQQMRGSSRPDLTSPQNYHQLQPPPAQTSQSQAQAQQQQPNYSYSNRSYYNTTVPAKSAASSYKTAVSQSYNYDMYKTYSTQQTGAIQNSGYTQKMPQDNVVKEQNLNNHNNVQQQQQTQQHKATHNLPPIAALSTYHPARCREAVRAPVSKPKTITTTTSTTSASISHPTIKQQYGLPQTQQQIQPHQARVPPSNPIDNHLNYRNTLQHNQYSIPNQYHNSYYTIAPSSSNNTFTTSYPQQSSASAHQTLRQAMPKTSNHEIHAQNQYQHPQNSSAVDSVLDLSLKTIKTPADSTLDDSEENQRSGKYYQMRQQQQQQVSQNTAAPRYPEPYTNHTHRNMQQPPSRQPVPQQQSASAPKVDFLPNFNMPMSQNYKPNERRQHTIMTANQNSYEKNYHHQQHVQQQQQQQQQAQQQRQPHQTLNTGQQQQHFNAYPQIPNNITSNNNNSTHVNNKKPMEGLPRIDFPSTNQIQKSGLYQTPQETQRKRAAQQLSTVVQNKRPKMDDRWKQAIDKQIEQKFSSYQNTKPPLMPPSKDLMVNGAFMPSNEKPTYQPNQYQAMQQPHHQYSNTNNNQYHHMNQTYVPSAAAHHYPSHISHGQQQQIQPQQQPQHPMYQQNLPRSNPHTNVNNGRSQHPVPNNGGGGADKRVISILRSNLEMKGAKEAQKKIEQTQFKTYDFNQRPREVQHPSTDVTAPLQPKHGFIGRQNVSPFTAASLIDRNTPPTYKFPKAIDSVRFEADIKDEKSDQSSLTNQADLDGLAANLAARIRTKGELKQVSQMQHVANYIRHTSPGLNETSVNGAANSSPPKEKPAYPPRRRLFSRNEEDNGEQKGAPPRDKTGLRSSSETSVFDFPDSGDESEVPVSERQSLEDMRRDRKSISKQSLINENDFKDEKPPPPVIITRIESPTDDIFNQACDNFLEELMKGGGKKRGRRKKMEADVLAKLETVTKEKPLNSESPEDVVVKIEESIVKEENDEIMKPIPPPAAVKELEKVTKMEEESDSDVPLSQCKKEITSEPLVSTVVKQEILPDPVPQVKPEMASDSDSETESKISQKMDEKQNVTRIPKESIGKSKELNAIILEIPSTITKPPKKPIFGDGSDFHPGWEEECFKYKKSLRMPKNLIQVTRPPNCNRLSTSLPDLDPCPSPTPSSITDTSEYCKFKTKTKSENFDSDMDSNSSFSFSLTKNYDSEEGSSSVKSLNVSNKITDRLLERYGGKKRSRLKKKGEKEAPKTIPKSDNALELLPTPSLELKNETKRKSEAIVKTDSVIFGFREKTIKNYKDTFRKNTKSLVGVGEQFTTVVLKSRTRTETRVLKQKATIREVFGEDRPASAPPVTCVDELKDIKKPEEIKKDPEDERKGASTPTTKEMLKNKLLNRGKKSPPSKGSAVKKKVTLEEPPPKEEEKEIKPPEPEIKSETPSVDGEENHSNKKRNKFRNVRRKGSSGFDYIRKKKKQVKKDTTDSDPAAKTKRRSGLPKTNLESVQDIQKEIKMWVLNKGIGETHLHRSARLGYTDITAYCLEKMQCSPSPKDNAGYTPLHEACSRGHLDIAKLLLMYGANASESAQGGIRPLHEAAENGYVEIVRLLLSYGADPNLATYSGSSPLSLAVEESTVNLLKNHINDVQGIPSEPWCFYGPASCFDPEEIGYDPLESPPTPDPPPEDEDVDLEVSEVIMPNLYTLAGEPDTDRWVLLQDLSSLLKIKSKDALLRQINPPLPHTSSSSSSSVSPKSILRELKMADFLERAKCCQFLNAGEKVNTRSSKVALVKYTDKVKQLLNVEKIVITAR